jgi:hypothetical protein
MTRKIVVAALAAILLSMAVPVAFANSTIWTSSSITQGATDQFTIHLDSATCPSGDHYVAAAYILGPGGQSSASSTQSCGVDAVFTYPTDFTASSGFPAPSTAVCGEYDYGASWSVYDPTGLLVLEGNIGHPAPAFTVTGCPTGVPQFPLGFALLFAVLVPAMLVLRNVRIRKPAVSV